MRQDLIWRLEAAAYRSLVGFLRLLGVERASALGGGLLRLLGPLTSTHKTVMRNLRIAFPDMPAAEREKLAIEQWDGTGRTFAEVAVMDQLTPEGGRVEVVGMERLHALRDSGRPAVLISGHLANFEVMAAVIMASGLPCQVTYRAANNPYVDALIRQNRERYGVRLFAPKGDGTRDLMAGMKRGDSIALLVDQKYNQGPEVQFFGQPVNASPGAARLAARFDTVMQPLSVVRLPGVRFRVTAHEPISIGHGEDKAADILAGIQAANRFVEDRVREHPVDWFWGPQALARQGLCGAGSPGFRAAAKWSGIVRRIATPPAGADIAFALDEGARPQDDGVDPVQHGLGGDRLDDEFVDPGVARLIDAGPFGMAGHHDDRQIGIGAVCAGADQARELHPVQREHVEIDDGQVDGVATQNVEGAGSFVRLMDVADIGGMQDCGRDRPHILIVVHQQDVQRFQRRHLAPTGRRSTL